MACNVQLQGRKHALALSVNNIPGTGEFDDELDDSGYRALLEKARTIDFSDLNAAPVARPERVKKHVLFPEHLFRPDSEKRAWLAEVQMLEQAGAIRVLDPHKIRNELLRDPSIPVHINDWEAWLRDSVREGNELPVVVQELPTVDSGFEYEIVFGRWTHRACVQEGVKVKSLILPPYRNGKK